MERDGFRVERKRRGLRPDRHEVWASSAIEVTPAEALERIVFVEAVLDKVKEQVEMAVGLAEDSVISSAERTAKLLKLVDGEWMGSAGAHDPARELVREPAAT